MPKAITTDPDVRGGVPCVAGTDVTVATVLRFLAGTTQLRMTWEDCPPDKMAAALNELADIYEQPPEPSPSIEAAAQPPDDRRAELELHNQLLRDRLDAI